MLRILIAFALLLAASWNCAFAARRAVPRRSLGVRVAAAQLLDLIWPPLVLAGVEQVRVDPGNTAFTPLDFVSYLSSRLFSGGHGTSF